MSEMSYLGAALREKGLTHIMMRQKVIATTILYFRQEKRSTETRYFQHGTLLCVEYQAK